MRRDTNQLKEKARELRMQGLSYREIQKEVFVAKSTLSLWLKNIALSQAHRKRLYTKQIEILSRGPQSQKERREREVEKIIQGAIHEVSLPSSYATQRLAGAFLYWAEGSKGKRFELSNSDPHLILFFVRWTALMFGIQATELKARLNVYPQQPEDKIKKFWSDLTGIPLARFGKSYIKPFSSGYKKNNLYYGTMRVEVPKGTDINYRVFGWIKGALADIAPDVEMTQRKWAHLRQIVRPVNLA